MKIGISDALTFVRAGMRFINNQDEGERVTLNANYRAAWKDYLEAVDCWQSSQAEEQAINGFSPTEATVQAAESRYRQARNEFADYLVQRSASYTKEYLLVSA